jgi:nucleotide-binding universal stress UspA family protein
LPGKTFNHGLDGRLTGEVILAHAKALGCDLLIKGAYTQSRLSYRRILVTEGIRRQWLELAI